MKEGKLSCKHDISKCEKQYFVCHFQLKNVPNIFYKCIEIKYVNEKNRLGYKTKKYMQKKLSNIF